MSRNKFLISILILFVIGRFLQSYSLGLAGLSVILIGTILVMCRRRFLIMPPLLDSRLKDIPKYFKLP
jgi:hypothetical protein